MKTRTGVSTVARVNLLPPEIAEGRKARRAYVAMGGAVVLAVAGVGMLYMNEASKVGGAKAKLQAAQAEQTRLQSQVRSFDSVHQVYEDVSLRQGQLAAAMAPEIRWSQYLNDLSLSMPANVWLVNAKFDNPAELADNGSRGTVTFTGKAFDHNDVAAWLESIARQKGYTNAYFSRSEKEVTPLATDRDLIEYDSTVQLTEKALSRRFEKKAGR
jgi:Tfp pilus assembly protein PilN